MLFISRIGDVMKIMGHEYSHSHAILLYYSVQQSETPKSINNVIDQTA